MIIITIKVEVCPISITNVTLIFSSKGTVSHAQYFPSKSLQLYLIYHLFIAIIFGIWVIPCQLTHFFPSPSPILMKFGRLIDPSERLTHTKFQLIISIIDEATALQRFLKFIKIFDFGTQNIL